MSKKLCLVTVTGRVGSVEAKSIGNKTVAVVSVVHNRAKKNKAGGWDEIPTWYSAEFSNDYMLREAEKLGKGDEITIHGEFQPNTSAQGKTFFNVAVQYVQINQKKGQAAAAQAPEADYDSSGDNPF